MEDNKEINVDKDKDIDNKDNDTITISQAELDKKIQQAIYTNSQNEKKKYEKELAKQKSLIGLANSFSYFFFSFWLLVLI